MSNYKKISANIHQVIIQSPKTDNKITWLNINNAGKKEIEYLRKKYNFKLAHLQAASMKSVAQRPDIIKEDNYFFMILHFPVFSGQKNHPENAVGNITSTEIEFFVGHGFLITMPNYNNETLNDFFKLCKNDGNSLLAFRLESSAILLYELLEKLILNCFALLDKNSIAIGQAEKIIFDQQQKKAAMAILNLRHNIINIRKIIQNHKDIIKKLARQPSSIIPQPQIKRYYNSLIERTKRIWEILENQRQMIEALNDSNESLLNYRLNNIMKTLTIFAVMTFPLTLVAAIFGMNVNDGMPLINTNNGFWVIISLMAAACLTMIFVFKKKRWL